MACLPEEVARAIVAMVPRDRDASSPTAAVIRAMLEPDDFIEVPLRARCTGCGERRLIVWLRPSRGAFGHLERCMECTGEFAIM